MRDEPLLQPWRSWTSKPEGLLHSGIRSLHSSGRIRAGRRRRRCHQAQTLQQHYGPLRRCPPDELATFSLTVLHVDVAAGVFEAAILEGAVDENPIIQDQVLVLENLVFVSSHVKTRLPLPGPGRKLGVDVFSGSLKSASLQPSEGPPDKDRRPEARQSRLHDSCQEYKPDGRIICTLTFLGEESDACTRALSRCSASA